MDSSEFRRRGKEMVDYIADYLENIHTRRVLPEVQPGYLREMLPSQAPKRGEHWGDIFKDIERAIMPGVTHWQHPRFHAYFPAGNSFPSILGDMLSDAIGCVGFSWAASPSCTELETVVMDWLAKMIGLPPVFLHEHGIGGGVIQGSASDCVLVSILAARHAALKELKLRYPFIEEGVLLSRLVAYCSKIAHSCVEKAGMISLVKIRELDIDDDFSLRGWTLQKAIDEDRKMGLIPFYVAATLGTTAVCSFDNLQELGLVCEKETIWLHVDAAYAGSALICPEFQHLIKGIEHANSFNMNPSKWMLVNFDCSTMWVRDRKVLTTALTVDPLYLQHHNSDKAVDFRHWGIPLSRRFRSLKLWLVIRTYGVEGLQKYIREHVKLAKKFYDLAKNDSRFEVVGKPMMGLVCFRLKAPTLNNKNEKSGLASQDMLSIQGSNYRTQTLLRAINMSGKLHMVPALINEYYIIRFAVCAQNANDDDIVYAWNVISEMATEVIQACDRHRSPSVALKYISSMADFSNKESEIDRLASLDISNDEQEVTSSVDVMTGNGSEKYEDEMNEDEQDEVFLYDDNIPSIPSLPTRYEAADSNAPYRRRNRLLRMISDPKSYNPQVLRQLSFSKNRHKSDASSRYNSKDSDHSDGTPSGVGTPV